MALFHSQTRRHKIIVDKNRYVYEFLILNSWETYLQKSIDFLLNLFFVFRNDYVCELIVHCIICTHVVIQNRNKSLN